MYDNVGVNILNPNEVKEKIAEEQAARTRVSGISPAVEDVITLPGAAVPSKAQPATQPAAPVQLRRRPRRRRGDSCRSAPW